MSLTAKYGIRNGLQSSKSLHVLSFTSVQYADFDSEFCEEPCTSGTNGTSAINSCYITAAAVDHAITMRSMVDEVIRGRQRASEAHGNNLDNAADLHAHLNRRYLRICRSHIRHWPFSVQQYSLFWRRSSSVACNVLYLQVTRYEDAEIYSS